MLFIYKLFLSYPRNLSVSKVCWKMSEIQMYYGAIEIILINLECDTIIYTQDSVNFMEDEYITDLINFLCIWCLRYKKL